MLWKWLGEFCEAAGGGSIGDCIERVRELRRASPTVGHGRGLYVAFETVTGDACFVGDSRLDVEKEIAREAAKYDDPERPCPYDYNIVGPWVRVEPRPGTATEEATRSLVRETQSFVPLQVGVVITNGGARCDMAIGPCSCGAWHTEDDHLPKDPRWLRTSEASPEVFIEIACKSGEHARCGSYICGCACHDFKQAETPQRTAEASARERAHDMLVDKVEHQIRTGRNDASPDLANRIHQWLLADSRRSNGLAPAGTGGDRILTYAQIAAVVEAFAGPGRPEASAVDWAARWREAFNRWALTDEGSLDEADAECALWNLRDDYDAAQRRAAARPCPHGVAKWNDCHVCVVEMSK